MHVCRGNSVGLRSAREEGRFVKRILRIPARAGGVRLGAAIILVAALAVAGGVTKSASAAGTTITITPTPSYADGRFTCDIDKLSAGTLTISVVVQTPTSGDTLAVDPILKGDEGSGTPGKQDVFTKHLSWGLTSDTTTGLTSYTNPGN